MKPNQSKEQVQEGSVVFPLKPYTIIQLAGLYGVSGKTLRRWLTPFTIEIGDKSGHYYTIAQVKIILAKLGVPGDLYTD